MRQLHRLIPLAVLCAALIAVLTLIGYTADLPQLYRYRQGIGTHPVTSLAVLLLGLGLVLPEPDRRKGLRLRLLAMLRPMIGVAAALLLFLQVLELAMPGVSAGHSGFYIWIDQTLGARPGVVTGVNTTAVIMLLCIAAFLPQRAPIAAVSAFAGLALAMVYAPMIGHLQGDIVTGMMAPSTALALILLGGAAAARHVHPIWLKIILAQSQFGRVLRLYLFSVALGAGVIVLMRIWLDSRIWLSLVPLALALLLLPIGMLVGSAVTLFEGEARALRRQLREFSRLSLTDPLTGLANRRAMELRIARLIGADLTSCLAPNFISVDLDQFKTVNDCYGHDAGDEILMGTARILDRISGETGMVARWGGEEFLILLHDHSPAQAAALAERARRALMAELSRPDGAGPITASFGCATLAASEDDPRRALSRADRALYAAKSAGRNRVCVAGRDGVATEVRALPEQDTASAA